KYETQKDALRSTLDVRPDQGPHEAWGGAECAGIAFRLLDSLGGPVQSLCADPIALRLDGGLLDLAVLAAHAHANRLGIHATQEATLRYLAWRARGGHRGSAP